MRTIHRRIYDNPIDENGKEKPNELLGNFKVIQQISEDMYAEQFIGLNVDDNQIYLVEGSEVSYKNGGVRYQTTLLTGLKVKE